MIWSCVEENSKTLIDNYLWDTTEKIIIYIIHYYKCKDDIKSLKTQHILDQALDLDSLLVLVSYFPQTIHTIINACNWKASYDIKSTQNPAHKLGI